MKIDISRADRKLRKAIKALSEKEVNKVAEKSARSLIRMQNQRIQSGIGSDGKAMKPYSPKYAAKRAATGRAVDKRTLHYTGQMLLSRIVLRVKSGAAQIGWKPGKQAEKAAGNEKRTPFTGATQAERSKLLEFIRRTVKETIKGRKGPPPPK